MLAEIPTLTLAAVRAQLRAAGESLQQSADALPDDAPEEVLHLADSLARDLADYTRRAEVLAARARGAPHHDRPAARCGDARDGGVVRRLGPAPEPVTHAPTANPAKEP